MNGRIRLRVWSVKLDCWRTCYVKPELLEQNRKRLENFGFLVRVG
jgi:hypothetical protein